MASIALVVATVGTNSGRIKTLLESFGHTVTNVVFSTMVLADLTPHDLVVTVSCGSDATQSNIVRDFFNTGKPVIVGPGSTSSGDSANPGTSCGICTTINANGSVSFTRVIWESKNMFSIGMSNNLGVAINNSAATFPYTFEWGESNSFTFYVSNTTSSPNGIHAAHATSSVNNTVLLACKAGAISLLGTPFPANIVFFGALYGGAVLTPLMPTLMRNVLAFALGQVKEVIGVVQSPVGVNVARKVRLYNRANGRFIDEGLSDAGTGNYRVVTYDTTDHTVVCLDADGGVKNALIHDRMTPTPWTG
jgi:hypothetical protein